MSVKGLILGYVLAFLSELHRARLVNVALVADQSQIEARTHLGSFRRSQHIFLLNRYRLISNIAQIEALVYRRVVAPVNTICIRFYAVAQVPLVLNHIFEYFGLLVLVDIGSPVLRLLF